MVVEEVTKGDTEGTIEDTEGITEGTLEEDVVEA